MFKKENIFWCKTCVSMSTRPRITFNEVGLCNACQWAEKKKKINWEDREKQLQKLLDKYRKNDGSFDCLVPVSGGKDGSYIAHNLKHKYNMNPLCVTIRPPLASELGNKNLQNFIDSGFKLISVDPGYEAMKILNKVGFFEMGFPYYGWLLSIFTGPPIIAKQFGIDLIFYSEDGEVEYGGSDKSQENFLFSPDYIKKIYYEGGYEKVIKKSNLLEKDLYFFKFPEDQDKKLKFTHWSFFENWDPYRNYLYAKKNCGLIANHKTNMGTFTNFAQNDQALYHLHTHVMYLKFGFGRTNQDASIEIRRGAMSREQAINLVKVYDGNEPSNDNVKQFISYYEITLKEYQDCVEKWTNKKLFKKEDKTGLWKPIFSIE